VEIVDKVIRCHCGFEARAEHEAALVGAVQRHASDRHGMTLSRDEALLLVVRAGLGDDSTGSGSGSRRGFHDPRTTHLNREEEE